MSVSFWVEIKAPTKQMKRAVQTAQTVRPVQTAQTEQTVRTTQTIKSTLFKQSKRSGLTMLKQIMEVIELETDRLWIYPGYDAGRRKRDHGPGNICTQGTL